MQIRLSKNQQVLANLCGATAAEYDRILHGYDEVDIFLQTRQANRACFDSAHEVRLYPTCGLLAVMGRVEAGG